MALNEIITDDMNHWYKCKECEIEIPLPDDKVQEYDDKKAVQFNLECPNCDAELSFKFTDKLRPCSKKEGRLRWTIFEQQKEGKIGSKHRKKKK